MENLTMKQNVKQLIPLLLSVFLLSACSSLGDYEFSDYDGELIWEEVTSKAAWGKRLGHDVAVLNDELYIAGGYNQGSFRKDPYYEDVWKTADGENWISVTENAPWLGRRGHALVTFNDGNGEALYLIGGFSVNEATDERTYNNDVWKSTDGENWTLIKSNTEVEVSNTSDWVARMNHKCVVANHGGQDYIYLVGGGTMLDEGEGRYAYKYLNDVWRTTDGINWQKMNATNFGIRAQHAMTVDDDGTIYLQGGQHGVIFEAADSSGNNPVQHYDEVWKTTDGENWTPISGGEVQSSGFFNRVEHEMVFYNDKIWTLPGQTNSVNHYTFTSVSHYGTWTLDKNDNFEIDSRGIAIDARHSYAAIVWRDKIWVLGGNTNRNGQDNDIWVGSL